jgi:hypothetical protein
MHASMHCESAHVCEGFMLLCARASFICVHECMREVKGHSLRRSDVLQMAQPQRKPCNACMHDVSITPLSACSAMHVSHHRMYAVCQIGDVRWLSGKCAAASVSVCSV